MTSQLADLLDFELAWKRVKRDITRPRVFINHPYEITLIEENLEEWLSNLASSVREGNYNPSPALICEVPKPGAAIRPGAHLKPEDQVMFAASIEAAYKSIFETLAWSQGTVDYNYQLLSPEIQANSWFKSKFAWPDFNTDTKTKIEAGTSYVVMTDICGYYENINLGLLISDLRSLNVPGSVANSIYNSLKMWSDPTSGEGIPQGHSPSDILGKLYLDYVDRHLQSEGVVHTRWVDDFRIFCSSLTEARQAIMLLTRLLRERGLNLQSAKTKIYRANQALDKVSEVENKLRPLVERLREKAFTLIVEDTDPYLPIYRIDEIFASRPDEAPIDAIKQAFRVYYIEAVDSGNFDKTFFRFLLKRLRSVRDNFAVEFCKGIFIDHPEETHTILAYFEDVDAYIDVENTIVDFLNSDAAIYDYQKYQIIEWLCKLPITPSNTLVSVIRNIIWGNSSSASYLRAACWEFLGQYGTASDLERARNSYSNATNHLEQCEIICALRRMEKGRRNEFYGRIRLESEMHHRAVRFAKAS